MSASETASQPRRRIGLRVGVAVFALLIAVVLVGYVFRGEIGAHFASAYLRSRGIESGISIQNLGLHGFSGRLRLGPAADPDISADRVDVDLTLAPPWSATPFQVVAHRVHLLRPVVKLGFKDGKISLGGLDRLIGPARPGTLSPPLPDIDFEDGSARIVTANGVLTVHGSGAIHGGRPVRLALRSDAGQVRFGDWSAQVGPGALKLDGASDAATANLALPIIRLDGPSGHFAGGDLKMRFSGNIARAGPLSGHGRLIGHVALDTTYLGHVAARALTGDVDMTLDRFAVSGGRFNLSGSGAIKSSAADLDQPGSSLRGASVNLQVSALTAAFDQGRWSGGGAIVGAVKASGVDTALAGAPLRLSNTVVGAKGVFSLSPKGLSGSATADIALRGALPKPDAAHLTQAVAGIDAGYGRALASALESFRLGAPRVSVAVSPGQVRLGAGAPWLLSAASGAKLALSPVKGALVLALDRGRMSGAGTLSVSGGGLPAARLQVARYDFSGGKLDAQLGLDSVLDVGPFRQARINAAGRLQLGSNQVRFDPEACVNLSANHIDMGDQSITAPSGRICAAPGAPLIAASNGGWRVQGLVQDAGLASDFYKLSIAHLDAAFEAVSAGASPTAKIHLNNVVAEDTSAALRFRPLGAHGDLGFDHGLWSGKFAVATAAKHGVGTIELRHDTHTGEGQALLDAPSLTFSRGGFQPADISPIAAPLRSAQGEARFKGVVGWSRQSLTSSGELSTAGLDFASPLGAVSGVATDLHLASLLPLKIAPGQVVTARKLDAVVPLDAIRLVFGLDETALAVQSGHIAAAGGQITIEPVSFPLASGQVAHGVIVLNGIDLGKLVATSSLSDKVKLDIVVDGRLPYEWGPDGFKLLDGSLVAVRPGRLEIQRSVFVGTVQPNAIQDFAYQALANLAFDSLSATVASRPGGRLGVVFHVKGRHDPAVGQEAFVGVKQLADGSAFQKPIPLPKGTPIDLTLDTSLNFDQLLADYQRALALGHAPAQPAPRSGAVQR